VQPVGVIGLGKHRNVIGNLTARQLSPQRRIDQS
jgi:hypothetical protein